MQAARVACGLKQCKHFLAKTPPRIELLKLMPRRNQLARELEHSRQPQHSQNAQHLHVHRDHLGKVKRRNRHQIDQRIKTKKVTHPCKRLARKVGVHGRCRQAQQILHREDAYRQNVKHLKLKRIRRVHLGNVFKHHRKHTHDDQHGNKALKLCSYAVGVVGVKQCAINAAQSRRFVCVCGHEGVSYF